MPNPEGAQTTAAAQETLWKRSRRTLGDKYFAFLKGTADPAPLATAGQEPNDSVSDSQSTVYAKRREQIRRSQRTHRARTEKYVLGLEAEVGRLRLAHADCVALVKSLQSQLDQLVPQTEYGGAPADINPQPNFRGPANSSRETSWTRQPNVELPGGFQDLGRLPNAQDAPCSTNPMLSSQIGLEFVMRLEEPCLSYVRRDLASSQDSPPSDSCLPTPLSSCAMPRKIAAEVHQLMSTPDPASAERLLALSSRLDLGDDLITPIQAWDSTKAHPRACLLTADKMNDLLARSYSLISCHRHGAALNKAGFKELLDDILGEALPSV